MDSLNSITLNFTDAEMQPLKVHQKESAGCFDSTALMPIRYGLHYFAGDLVEIAILLFQLKENNYPHVARSLVSVESTGFDSSLVTLFVLNQNS